MGQLPVRVSGRKGCRCPSTDTSAPPQVVLSALQEEVSRGQDPVSLGTLFCTPGLRLRTWVSLMIW